MADITDVLMKLHERTVVNKVSWQATADESAFAAVVGNHSLVISIDSVGDPVLKILNVSGTEIEKLDGGVGDGREWRDTLYDLYTMARRIALGVDSQLADLLKELEADV